MDEQDLLFARFRELADRAYSRGYATHTDFLSLSEQNVFFDLLKKENVLPERGLFHGAHYGFLGGHDESDRKILFFSPEPLSKEGWDTLEEGTIACLCLTPKNIHYADSLTHRDYLGALMHLGYDRRNFGDILTDSTIGYVFLLKRVAEDVRENLVKIRHTPVEGKILPPHSCPFVFRFEDRTVYLCHNRIDAVIKEAFDLSRRDSQEKIGKEEVFVDGHVVRDNSFRLKPGVRVSVRGKGKFLYVGDERKTKKDRIVTTIRLYR